MGIGRRTFLWASKNNWLKNRIPKLKFVQKAVKRFMPGTTAEDAIEAARKLSNNNISSTFTLLGENITSLNEADNNTQHYLNLLDQIKSENFPIELSLKLTQIGFDIDSNKTVEFFSLIAEKAKKFKSFIFIDIEDSSYVTKTIEFYKIVKEKYDNVGLCLQAYLYRTEKDLEELLINNSIIRLVKGAYNEPETVAFKRKRAVDKNYFLLAKNFLTLIQKQNIRLVFATHDLNLIAKIKDEGARINLSTDMIEFHMLFGIKSSAQADLALSGYKIRVLISYGESWFPWYMRRLAERPANVLFILKNLFK